MVSIKVVVGVVLTKVVAKNVVVVLSIKAVVVRVVLLNVVAKNVDVVVSIKVVEGYVLFTEVVLISIKTVVMVKFVLAGGVGVEVVPDTEAEEVVANDSSCVVVVVVK